MELHLIEVEQGNDNGQAIAANSETVLRTIDLVGCIAVLIVGKDQCYMIHSDSNTKSGKGEISLVEGIKSLGLNTEEAYKVGLIGGSSSESLSVKYEEVEKVLSNSTLTMTQPNVDAAYLTSDGVMAATKKSLAKQLGVEISDLELTQPSSRCSLS